MQSYRGAVHRIQLDSELTGALKALARESDATLFMVLFAAFSVLLHRYSNQADIRVGVPLANRTRFEIERLIGFFVNTLVFRTNLDGNPSFEELLDRVKSVALGAQAHQDLPFEQLVEALNPERSLSHSPLFQVMYNHIGERPSAARKLELGHLNVEALPQPVHSTPFELTLDTHEDGAELHATFTYSTDLFDAPTIERLALHFRNVLRAIVEQPRTRIEHLPLLSELERRRVLTEWNATRGEYPLERGYVSLFEEQVRRHPERIAARSGERSVTYAALNRRSNRLAHALLQAGVGRDELVAVLDERGIALLSMILGTFKAGAGYLPLDPRHPPARMLEILRSSRPRVVLSTTAFGPVLDELRRALPETERPELLFLEQLGDRALPEQDPGIYATGQDLAYVIYTSGSTGTPKGAMVEHAGMLNNQLSKIPYLELCAEDVIAQTASQCFDISVWQLLTALLCGARTEIVPEETTHDPSALFEYAAQRGVTVLELVPTLLNAALATERLPPPSRLALRWLLPTGEALPPDVAQRWFARYPEIPLVNAYGPAECSDDVALHVLRCPNDAATAVPIGTAVHNLELYVVTPYLELAPPGVVGELCVGGIGVGRGYLGDPGRTADVFVLNPFGRSAGARLYRTGDLARYRADGVIEYVGRRDHQVKLRGYRIELGEIEARLAAQPELDSAVVLLREDRPGERRLVAYVVPKAGGARERDPRFADELRERLLAELPEYMVPAHYALLERLPLTPNGKIDRAALPALDSKQTRNDSLPPQTELEQTLAQIWQSLLHLDQVGIGDNFFALGGDSILALQVVSRAASAGVQLTPKDLFQHQTLEALARAADGRSARAADQGLASGEVALTQVQRWFFEQDQPEVDHYNQSALLEALQPLDVGLLERALTELVAHHDALRLRYRKQGDTWVQAHATEAADSRFCWEVDLSANAEPEPAIAQAATAAQRSLSLENGPLVRALYIHLGPTRNARLLLVVHHLVADGASFRILLDDLASVYQQLLAGRPARLPPKTSSLQRWAQLLQEYARSEPIERELDHWRRVTRKDDTELPARADEAANLAASARALEVELTESETQKLLGPAREAYRTSIDELLLAALAHALCDWSRKPSALIELEAHGRENLFPDADVSRTIGWFATRYPVRLTPDTDDLGRSIASIKDELRRVPQRGFGYGILRYLSAHGSELARGGRPRIAFNYLDHLDDQSSMFRLARESEGEEQSRARAREHWFEVNAVIQNARLRVIWSYSENLHRREEVAKVAQAHLERLREIIRHCLRPDAGAVTPSDFAHVSLDAHELEDLLSDMG
jgi:amino acid adenylation domain-containing protein/non-ribosomal peptide synthase protein (TIGR01720 family)